MADKKALIVDDEFHIVQVVSIKLKNNGFDVATAENGRDAYDLVCEEKPDIIVTDYQMPAMTGVQLIEKLRENADTAAIPVIMLTARGFALEDDVQQKLNIAACLSKPFSPREVLQVVEDILRQTSPV